MASAKKKNRPEFFAAKDVAKSLNRDIGAGSKKMSLEEASLRKLVVQAVKEKKFSALKQLLWTFDECGAISLPEPQSGVYFFPKIWDLEHYRASLIRDGARYQVPKDYEPKLSKIGEREAAKRAAAYRAERVELDAKGIEAARIINQATSDIKNVRDPFEGLHEPSSSTGALTEKLLKLDQSEIDARMARQSEILRLDAIRISAFDTFQIAVTEFNKKFGTKLKLNGSGFGYKKPPRHTRFKKGQSGNPAGRPPAKRSKTDLVREIGNEEITITENGCKASKRVIEIVFDVLAVMALTNPRAASLRRKYLDKYDPPPNPNIGFLVVPEQVSGDECMELLEEHRLKCEEDARARNKAD